MRYSIYTEMASLNIILGYMNAGGILCLIKIIEDFVQVSKHPLQLCPNSDTEKEFSFSYKKVAWDESLLEKKILY